MRINDSLLESVIDIAKEAGEAILNLYNSRAALEIKNKVDNSPVTLADLLAHDIIVKRLSALLPQTPILSEEDANFSFDTRRNWNLFWLVDPLDGTKEYIQRNGQFTVNIALIENFVPILGVIYIPLKNTFYYAAEEIGAFKRETDGRILPLQTAPWFNGEELVLVTTRREIPQDLQKLLQPYGGVTITYRSSSLKFCLIAEGLADIYLRKKPIQEWDTAAGQCIVEQAGGTVLDSNWERLRYNTKSHLLNPPFLALGDSKQLLPILKTMPMF